MSGSAFNNPPFTLKVGKERFTAMRKALKMLSAFDNRAADMLNKINERVKIDGEFCLVGFFPDEPVRFAYLFAALSESYVSQLTSVHRAIEQQQNALADTAIALESVLSSSEHEEELIADKSLRSYRSLVREQQALIKRYIRNGCGGKLIQYGDNDYEEDSRLPEITGEYLDDVADYLGESRERVRSLYQEMLSCYELTQAIGYPDIGRGDKSLTSEQRTEKMNRLCELIPKYSIDFSGFQYGSVLAKKMNCTESLFRRAMQKCKEDRS